MKKIVVLLLVCCLLAGGVFGFLLGKDGTIRATAPAVTPAAVMMRASRFVQVSRSFLV